MEINAQGSVIDLTKNIGVAGTPIILRWLSYKYLISPEYIIDTKSTDKNGVFSFRNSIDTTFFSKGYELAFILPENSNYIMFPNYDEPIYVHRVTDSVLNSLRFNLYRKAKLQIQLERVEKDSLEGFIVEHTFLKLGGYIDQVNSRTVDGYVYPLNTTINAETASDIKTYIKWTKSIGKTRIENIDSIICTKDKITTYKIKY